MKKSNLWFGIGYLMAGVLFLVLSFTTEGRLSALFTGLTGPGLGAGLIGLGHYFYWTRPQNKARYDEKIEQEKINLQDERKVMLRDRSGRYAYLIGLIVIFGLLITFHILDAMQVVEGKSITLVLFAYLVFQYVIGIVIFQYLGKKH